jgi:dTDP-4-amino-4,6-dideoxygalactose transaminase
VLNTPFAPWPSFTDEEADAAARVIRSNKVNYWTGQECRHFEEEYAVWSGTRHAVALANGTLALDVALKALRVGPGDDVIVTPRTFLASVSCVVNAGARPVFADVDRDSGNMTADSIRAVLTPTTKAILCVHLAGWPCDMEGIMRLADERKLYVVEDCAQAHGARVRGRMVGSIGHIGAWSFCQDKIITTAGEGGMVTTNDPELWSRMWSYKDHGKSWAAVHEMAHPPGYRWVHESFGSNWRMLEVQGAIGRIQLSRMNDWTAQRTANAQRIVDVCRRHRGVRVPLPAAGNVHAFYRLYVYTEPAALKRAWDRERIVEELVARGVPCYSGSCSEVYLEKAFDHTTFRPATRLPVAKELGETSLMFLVHPTLTAQDLEKTCSVLDRVLGEASA